ncbi:hypothetical protein [Pelotalea chapellei]|uniref:Uncharacterized protein n=1 Tax=Pelotalea chapellei TaxID=44671 RepID=A0ABS5U4H9_9BACT|nr:hypothetical protein [Pelotalea chapellei]MBT1070577.1 hypothetical protein [Pelotalea chapellei]
MARMIDSSGPKIPPEPGGAGDVVMIVTGTWYPSPDGTGFEHSSRSSCSI